MTVVDTAVDLYKSNYATGSRAGIHTLVGQLQQMSTAQMDEYYRRVIEFRHAMARAEEEVEWPR